MVRLTIQIAAVLAAVTFGLWRFGFETYVSVAACFYIVAGGILVRQDSRSRQALGTILAKRPSSELGWILGLSLLAGAVWIAWPVIVVFGFDDEPVVAAGESLQGPSTSRRKSGST